MRRHTLRDEQVAQFTAWCERQGNAPCPHCGQHTWQVGELVYAPFVIGRGVRKKALEHADVAAALVSHGCRYLQLICLQCGLVYLFDADVVGIVN